LFFREYYLRIFGTASSIRSIWDLSRSRVKRNLSHYICWHNEYECFAGR
jgi:hypothetical protein